MIQSCKAIPDLLRSVENHRESIVMNFTVGEIVEAVDEFGVWASARITENRGDSVVVTFPQWKSDWDREITSAREVRKRSIEEVLVPRSLASHKVS